MNLLKKTKEWLHNRKVVSTVEPEVDIDYCNTTYMYSSDSAVELQLNPCHYINPEDRRRYRRGKNRCKECGGKLA